VNRGTKRRKGISEKMIIPSAVRIATLLLLLMSMSAGGSVLISRYSCSCCCDALSTSSASSAPPRTGASTGRRDALGKALQHALVATAGSAAALLTLPSSAAATAAASATPFSPLPLQTAGSSSSPATTTVRVEEIGGGFDLLSPPSAGLSTSDVLFPASMVGTTWRVQRVVTSVEGDLGQAGIAWSCLGGSSERAFTSKLTEVYDTRFIEAPSSMLDDAATYEFDGTILRGAILDRAYEMQQRAGVTNVDVSLDPTKGNILTYIYKKGDPIELAVVQRRVEKPTDVGGFGSDELYRIKSSAGGVFGNTAVYRAARVRRRYRRGYDEGTGKRVVDGIEIVTTYRVLDGVAGVEMPTSTFKSRIRMTQL